MSQLGPKGQVREVKREGRVLWIEGTASRKLRDREGGRDFRLCWTCILGSRILVSLQNDEKLLESLTWGREP